MTEVLGEPGELAASAIPRHGLRHRDICSSSTASQLPFPSGLQGASGLSRSGSDLSGRLGNLENLTLPFVMLLALPEKEKLVTFFFTSTWHLAGQAPGHQAATGLLWE